MDQTYAVKTVKTSTRSKRTEWRFQEKGLLVLLHIFLLILQSSCQTLHNVGSSEPTDNATKLDSKDINLVNPINCHNCHTDSNDRSNDKFQHVNMSLVKESQSLLDDVLDTVGEITEIFLIRNKTKKEVVNEIEKAIDVVLSKDRYVILQGVEIQSIENKPTTHSETSRSDKENERGLFSKYTYEYRLWQKIKTFFDTHILSISLPKAANLMGFRSFGLKKFFIPLLIGAQVFKSILLAMFLPSILGSFGKMLGKGISSLSASSSQASYPPAPDEPDPYGEPGGAEPGGAFAYPQDVGFPSDDAEAGNIDLSRFGTSQKSSYLPAKNGYYKNQLQAAASNNYKVFQKIPASSMILSNYDPFYSPLLSRLDGIFARLGLAPTDAAAAAGGAAGGGQALSDVKLEACREQLVCQMYASPAKYAPYSNLVSAQLSRELNELRRPVSDNPEILRFFRYMRAARRGQERADCERAHPACAAPAPAHTMLAAYHDINKLVTARKLGD